MTGKDLKQPEWFWRAVVAFFLFEYAIIYIIAKVVGMSPRDLLMISFYISVIAYPSFFVIVMMFLPRGSGLILNTIFYLLLPMLLYFPFWIVVGEGVNAILR